MTGSLLEERSAPGGGTGPGQSRDRGDVRKTHAADGMRLTAVSRFRGCGQPYISSRADPTRARGARSRRNTDVMPQAVDARTSIVGVAALPTAVWTVSIGVYQPADVMPALLVPAVFVLA